MNHLPKKVIYKEIINNGFCLELREAYLQIHNELNLEISGIFNLNNWIAYVYYTNILCLFFHDKNIKIIDWGGGFGHVTKMLENLFFNNIYNYVLYPPKGYEVFADKLSIKSIYGKHPSTIELSTTEIDCLISSGVFEHVQEDGIGSELETLLEIHRVLKPGGYFILWNLPTKLSLPDIKNKFKGNWYHVFRYSRKEITSLLNNNGFKIILLEKHKLLPDFIYNYVINRKGLLHALIFDERISLLFPFSIFARDFIIIAQKQ